MNSPICIGVDVSKATLEIALEGQPGHEQIANTPAAIRAWLRRWPSGCLIGVESTGTYHQAIARLALAAGQQVYLLNARDLSHYARALGRRAKTDRLDAQLIARYLRHEQDHLHPYRLPSALQAQLDALISRRHTVVAAQVTLRQSFRTLTHPPRSWTTALRALTRLLDDIDQRLQDLVAGDPTLAPIARNLRTLVGFGPLLSHAMANALTRHPFRNADAFIAFVGYDPRPRDSGQCRGRRFLSKRGPAEWRRLLYVAAMSASRTALWRPFYQRYRARGLSTTATLVILARKLARIAFSIVKHGTVFNPQLVQPACAQP